MTNKTDEMPQWDDVMHEPVLYARDLDGTGSLHPCSKGDEGAIALYMRPSTIDISDERIKAALDEFENEIDVTCDPIYGGSICGREGEMILSQESCQVIVQVLTERDQMIMCIKDLVEGDEWLAYDDKGIALDKAVRKHAQIIQKCRGKDNG